MPGEVVMGIDLLELKKTMQKHSEMVYVLTCCKKYSTLVKIGRKEKSLIISFLDNHIA